MATVTAGYDVGGAHLKVSRVEGGRVTGAAQFPSALWKGLDQLDAALAAAHALTQGAAVHAVTMTGELCELFETRADGVVQLAEHLSSRLGSQTRFYRALGGFTDAAGARADPERVASANFLATATVVAKLRPNALLIDMGSTTTDIVACDRPQGLSDAERLQTGELVYTGYTRTPVPSVATRAVLAGQWQSLARDHFASMADVRRVLGELPEGVDQHDTADGRSTSLEHSLARLARGFGRDGELRHLPAWRVAAAHIREQQMRSIYDGAVQVLSRPGLEMSCVVSAGIGAPAAATIANRLGLACISFGDVIDAAQPCRMSATRFAPAVAVALLAAQDASG